MEQSEAMEYGSWKASPDFLKPRYIYIYIEVKVYKYIIFNLLGSQSYS